MFPTSLQLTLAQCCMVWWDRKIRHKTLQHDTQVPAVNAKAMEWTQSSLTFLSRDVIYTSRAYATMSVSVCLWRKCIGAFRFQIPIPIYHALRSRCMRSQRKGSSPGRVEGSSRAMLVTARPSCSLLLLDRITCNHCIDVALCYRCNT